MSDNQASVRYQESEVSLSSGTIIGERYRILSRIGQGGMGQVYAVEDTKLGNKLRALKVNSMNQNSLTADEAFVLMRLDHPGLPQLVDYFPSSGSSSEMLVMDYINGSTLEQLVQERGIGLGLLEATGIAAQLCSALAYLHRQQPAIIHRDLKPSNVMVDREGRARLIDFGIARFYKPDQGSDTRRLGTPGFAAPEQEAGLQSDARTDIYGLGRLMDWLVTGGLHRIVDNGLRNGNEDEQLPSWLLKMLEPEPARRFANMEEAAAAIRDWVELHGQKTAASSLSITRYGAGDGGKLRAVSIISLSPGSGATFLSIMLARMLAEQGQRVQAVEAPHTLPEWHALLGFAGRNIAMDGPDPRYRKAVSGGVTWQLLHPDSADWEAPDGEARFRLLLSAADRQAVQLLDWSSRWHDSLAEEWLTGSGMLVICADPNPSRWSAAIIRKLKLLLREREEHGLATAWAACKDTAFRERRQWLSLLPAAPDALIPYVPAPEWYDMLWNGMLLPRKGRTASSLRRALEPLAIKVSQSLLFTEAKPERAGRPLM